MRFSLLLFVAVVLACHRPATRNGAVDKPASALDAGSPVSTPAGSEIPDYSRYVRLGVSFIAVGNEPFWSLTIQPDRQITFRTPTDSLSVPVPEPTTAPTRERVYEARTNAGQLRVSIRPVRYTDSMSGQPFDNTVTIGVKIGTVTQRTYTGGGTALNQLMLMSEHWVITSLNDQPVQVTGRQQPYLELQPSTNRVSGTSGCNQFTGTFRADNQTLLLGALVTTRMACLDPLANTFESNLVKALKGPLQYTIEQGKLTLSRNGKPVLVAKRRD